MKLRELLKEESVSGGGSNSSGGGSGSGGGIGSNSASNGNLYSIPGIACTANAPPATVAAAIASATAASSGGNGYNNSNGTTNGNVNMNGGSRSVSDMVRSGSELFRAKYGPGAGGIVGAVSSK